jgi:CRISPR-associated protein Csh2
MTLNRSEMLFVYDAQDCNPNGNPIGDNRPRRDPDTGKGIITDVRLKRYLRDQLLDDGFDIYVKKLDGDARPRTTLALDVLGDVDDAGDVEEIEDIGERFLEAATDVRYFGATLSFESSDEEADENLRQALNSAFPSQYQGPVQFLPSKSLNEVEDNEEYDSLTSVISTGEEARQGGFDLDDKRIKYGISPFGDSSTTTVPRRRTSLRVTSNDSIRSVGAHSKTRRHPVRSSGRHHDCTCVWSTKRTTTTSVACRTSSRCPRKVNHRSAQ